jgi:hypothetical protein
LGHKFSLILSREITDAESAILQEDGFFGASFGIDSLPTNAEVTVTKVDLDDTVSPSLVEAIESALEAVKKVPDLGVPSLTVPALPVEKTEEKTDEAPGTVVGEVIEEKPESVTGEVTEGEPGTEGETAKKTATRKVSAKKAGNGRTSSRKTSARKTSTGKATADEADSVGVNDPVATTSSSD